MDGDSIVYRRIFASQGPVQSFVDGNAQRLSCSFLTCAQSQYIRTEHSRKRNKYVQRLSVPFRSHLYNNSIRHTHIRLHMLKQLNICATTDTVLAIVVVSSEVVAIKNLLCDSCIRLTVSL